MLAYIPYMDPMGMAVYVVITPCMAKRHKDDGQTSVENPSSLKFPYFNAGQAHLMRECSGVDENSGPDLQL